MNSNRMLKRSLMVTLGLVFATMSQFAMSKDNSNTLSKDIEIHKVTYTNHLGIKLVGNLYFPKGFDSHKKYPVIVTSPPAGGAKEQTAGLYAGKMAQDGYLAIAFDASFQGESGGTPRFKEDPIARVEDIRGTIDYLVTLPYVDANKIGVLGICAGGGYAASAAMTERRIRAVGVVVPVNGGGEMRAGGQKATIDMLDAVALQRNVEARGGAPLLPAWIPDEYKDAEDIDLREGYAYYRSERGANPNWPNKMLFTSLDAVMAFDAFQFTDLLLTQPLEIIIGSKKGAFGSNKDGHELYTRAASTQKELIVMEGASHFDMYDNPKYVNDAVTNLSHFYAKFLK